MLAKNNYAQYGQLDLGNKTREASPERLIFLLCEKACSSIQAAVLILEREEANKDGEIADWRRKLSDVESFQTNSSKVMQIISVLKELLDFEKGEPVASQLNKTYDAILGALWKATNDKDLISLKKILESMRLLKDAWKSLSLKG